MKRYILFILLFVSAGFAQGQSNNSASETDIITSYFSKAANHAIIYSGKEHMKYPMFVIGHPYLIQQEYETGNLLYDGILYPDIKMKLDKYKDELIVQSPDNFFNIVIPSDKVEYADLFTFQIIYHTPDGLSGSPNSGYYIERYNNKYLVLERQKSNYQENIKDMKIEAKFVHSVRFYILKDDRYYQVKGKTGLLNVFKERKKELKQFIKNERLDFRNFPAESIVSVVKQYEKLEDGI